MELKSLHSMLTGHSSAKGAVFSVPYEVRKTSDLSCLAPRQARSGRFDDLIHRGYVQAESLVSSIPFCGITRRVQRNARHRWQHACWRSPCGSHVVRLTLHVRAHQQDGHDTDKRHRAECDLFHGLFSPVM